MAAVVLNITPYAMLSQAERNLSSFVSILLKNGNFPKIPQRLPIALIGQSWIT